MSYQVYLLNLLTEFLPVFSRKRLQFNMLTAVILQQAEQGLDYVRSFACHGFQLRKSKAFDTTLKQEKAIAAPAIMGFKYPSAANGMPTIL